MSELLYQKYRQKSWKDLIGNKKIGEELRQGFVTGNIPQNIYLHGATGTGKSTIAHLFARSVLCKNLSKEGEACLECDDCRDSLNEEYIKSFYHFHASDLTIEVARDIQNIARTRSMFGNKKVIFIDEVQELHTNKKALKNLLLVLEKVNKNVHFILGAMDDSKVDKAVRDRCLTYKLKDASFEDLAKTVKYIADKENIKLDEEKTKALFIIAENCNGSFREAIDKLERCINADVWSEEAIKEELHIVSNESLQEIALQLLTGDAEIFANKIEEEIIRNLRYSLVQTFKYKVGAKLNGWQQQQIKKLVNCNEMNLAFTIDKLNSLMKFPYLDVMLIEGTIAECIMHNKQNQTPVRRRV